MSSSLILLLKTKRTAAPPKPKEAEGSSTTQRWKEGKHQPTREGRGGNTAPPATRERDSSPTKKQEKEAAPSKGGEGRHQPTREDNFSLPPPSGRWCVVSLASFFSFFRWYCLPSASFGWRDRSLLNSWLKNQCGVHFCELRLGSVLKSDGPTSSFWRCLPSPPLGGATFLLSPVGWCRHPSWGGVAFLPSLLGGAASLPPPLGGVVFDSLLWEVLCFFLFPCEWCGFPQWCVSSHLSSGAAFRVREKGRQHDLSPFDLLICRPYLKLFIWKKLLTFSTLLLKKTPF